MDRTNVYMVDEHVHDVLCSTSRALPIGTKGCICLEVRKLRAAQNYCKICGDTLDKGMPKNLW